MAVLCSLTFVLVKFSDNRAVTNISGFCGIPFQLSDSNVTTARSGNPGYQVGKTLLYGTLNSTTSAEGVTTYPFRKLVTDKL